MPRSGWIFLRKNGPSGGGVLTDVSPADYMKETDYYTHLTKVIAGKPDAILLIGASEPAALIVKQARELGFQGKFILGDQAKLDEMVKVITIDKLEGTIAVTPLYHRPIKDAPAFTKAYQKRFGEGEVATFEAASHYESLYLLAYAMEVAGYPLRRAEDPREPFPRFSLWRSAERWRPREYLDYGTTAPSCGSPTERKSSGENGRSRLESNIKNGEQGTRSEDRATRSEEPEANE